MALSDHRLTTGSIYRKIVLAPSNSEIELTEHLIQPDGNRLVQDSIPEVDLALSLNQSAGSHMSNSARYVFRFIDLSVVTDTKDAAASRRSL
jgi:hypothetical protein